MNKKILTLALAQLAYSPTPDLSSTFLKMSPVVMGMKQYMETSNIPSFERATHNMQYNPMSRQTVVFDFIDDLIESYDTETREYNITQTLKEQAEKVNKEFSISKGEKVYDELLEALKRKHSEVIQIFSSLFSDDNSFPLSSLSPILALALYSEGAIIFINRSTNSNLFMEDETIEETIKDIFKIKGQSTKSLLKAKAADLERKILEKLLERAEDTHHYSDIAKIAHSIRNIEIANRALEEAFNNAEDTSDYRWIAHTAHVMGSIEMANRAIQEGFNSANHAYDYVKITTIAHEIVNIEMSNRALQKAYNSPVIDIVIKNSIIEMAQKLNISLEESEETEAAPAAAQE